MLLLSALLGCLVCSLAALGVGAVVLRWLVPPTTQEQLQVGTVAMAASAFLLGQGLLAGIWTGIALAGWFTAPVILGSLSVIALGGAWATRTWFRPACRCLTAWNRNAWSDSWPWRMLFLATMLLVIIYVLASLVVAIPSHGDGAAYYLPFGKWLIAKGQLRPFPAYEAFSQMPVLGELHFAVMMFFGVEQEARFIVTPTTLAGAALLVALGARCGLGKRAQWMVLAMAWTSSTFAERLTDGKTDLFGFAMGAAAYYWVALYRKREDGAALRIAGLFVSLAALAKLSLVTSVLPGVALMATWTTLSQADGSSLIQRGRVLLSVWFQLALFALLLGVANFVKNGVLYGEPFAPFVLLSGSKTWLYQASFHSQSVESEVFLKYPLILVYGSVYGQGGNLSLLFLAFAPLLVLLPRPRACKHSMLLKTGCMAIVGLVCYLAASHITSNAQVAPRYILPTLMLFALPLARGAEYVLDGEPRPRCLTAMIWLALFGALYYTHRDGDVRRWVRHLGTHLTQGENPGKDSSVAALKVLNRLAAKGDRLYMCGATRLYLRTDLLQCLNSSSDSMAGDSPCQRWANLNARGFRWLFIDLRMQPKQVEHLGLQEDGHAVTPAWLSVERVFASESCLLYRLDPLPGAPPAQVRTEEVRPGVWEVLAR